MTTLLGDHSGYLKTLQKVKRDWYWQGMKQDINEHIKQYNISQRIKNETVKPAGLLQPFPIPSQTLNIFKLHGLPSSIVSDRDTAFTSTFWQELFTRQGTDLAMSTAYHPQTDGQTEVVNRSLEQYLKPLQQTNPTTPFEALYGYPPPRLLEYIPDTTQVEAVDNYLYIRQQALSLLKTNLVAAQERMKLQANKNRIEKEFQVGDWVYLRLQPNQAEIYASKDGKTGS
uniref:Integrase catalytic domain-containing protein n=1 Tax=Fagus sylvatica TaxID=28930 RepID=A0A2N9HAD2_FAGSY